MKKKSISVLDNKELPANITWVNEEPIEANTTTNVNISTILSQRGSRYGSYKNVALVSQRLKDAIDSGILLSGKNHKDIPEYIRESLDMICNKLARIACGDVKYLENYKDICGYSQLVIDELSSKDGSTDSIVKSVVRKNGQWIEQ